MGRKSRGPENEISSVISTRVTKQELIDIDLMGAEWNCSSRSETIRKSIQLWSRASPLLKWIEQIEVRRISIQEGIPLNDEEIMIVTSKIVDKKWMSVVCAVLAELIEDHIKHNGWFFPPHTIKPTEAVLALRLGQSRTAAAFLREQFCSYWAAGNGPASWVKGDTRLKRLIEDALDKRKNDVTALTLKVLRQVARKERHLVSFFQPQKAMEIYRENLNNITEPCVWDPSGGFGARMLGFYAAYPHGTYYAHEPASMTYTDLQQLRASLGIKGTTYKQGSEFCDLPDNSCDFVFTSPPYFDTEKYFDEPGQSYVEYPSLSMWVSNFVIPTMAHAKRVLKPNCKVTINTSKTLANTYIDAARDQGLKLIKNDRLLLKLHPFQTTIRPDEYYEPILTFQKEST